MISFLLAAALLASPENITTLRDSLPTVDIEEAHVVADFKQLNPLRRTATASTAIAAGENVPSEGLSLQRISGFVPNFYMPSYGSTQSSAIYIRGVGSRINTPAIGMYVDNVATQEKSAYSFRLLGVSRIDVLRGPQGTLYGAGAMGGLVHIHTVNPLRQQGTELATGFSSRDNRWYASGLSHHKFGNHWGLSVGAFYEGNRGLWHNATLHRRVGANQQGGGRARLVYQKNQWALDWTASYEYTDEKPYPYFYAGSLSNETHPQNIGSITANRESRYRRNLFHSAFTASYQFPALTLTSVTGYQLLDDRTLMDQDFIQADYYTLLQTQKAHTLTEELILKSSRPQRFEWTSGLFGQWEALRTQGPVQFYADGTAMLNETIASHLPTPRITVNNPRTGQPVTQDMPMQLTISDASFGVPTRFRSPVVGGAAYFQGSLHDVGISKLDLTVGMRLDYQHHSLTYAAGGPVNYHFSMPSHNVEADLQTSTVLQGSLRNDYTHLLPKVALQYELPGNHGNVYATVSKGMRAGGYNGQMFSDLMSNVMQNDMMKGTRDYCYDAMTRHAEQMPNMSALFLAIRQAIVDNIPVTELPDVASAVTYKPEYCWNYEAGAHLNLIQHYLLADVALFFTDTHNQQIARFSPAGLGRMMVNAGQSHSCGLEATLRSQLLNDRLTLSGNYGFTHAVFHRYNMGNGTDYTDNKVPFIPAHTMGLMADFCQPLKGSWVRSITFGVNGNGFGRIYWTEANNAYQNFYATLGAHAALDLGSVSVDVWGRNLTQTSYHTFYFESMDHGFYQKGNPLQVGIDLRWNL